MISEFNIFRPNRKLTQDEAMELAYYRVGERLSNDSYMTEVDGRECLAIIYRYRENGVGFIKVDLNTGEVKIDDYPSWEKYVNTKEELNIGTAYGWEDTTEQ